MKYRLRLVAALAALSLSLTGLDALAQGNLKAWATGGIQQTSAVESVNYAVASASSFFAGPPVCSFLSATSDKAGSVAQFYAATATVQLGTNTTPTNIQTLASSVGILTNSTASLVIIRHLATDTYDRAKISTNDLVSITLDPNYPLTQTTSTVNGDLLYLMAKAGKIPVGSATITIGPGGNVFVGQLNRPLLVETTGNNYTNVAINAFSGFYQQ